MQRGENICAIDADLNLIINRYSNSLKTDHLNGDSIISSSLLNNNDRANCLIQEEVYFANVPKSDNTDRFHVQTAGRSSNIWNHATKDVSALNNTIFSHQMKTILTY